MFELQTAKQTLKDSRNSRRSPPKVRVTNGQESRLDYLHRIANFCTTVLNIFSKKQFLATPNVENEC